MGVIIKEKKKKHWLEWYSLIITDSWKLNFRKSGEGDNNSVLTQEMYISWSLIAKISEYSFLPQDMAAVVATFGFLFIFPSLPSPGVGIN